jgi:hypothetical protein
MKERKPVPVVERVRQSCAQCGGELDYYDAEDGEEAVCSQCSCILAGCCDACDGECRGWAWPRCH